MSTISSKIASTRDLSVNQHLITQCGLLYLLRRAFMFNQLRAPSSSNTPKPCAIVTLRHSNRTTCRIGSLLYRAISLCSSSIWIFRHHLLCAIITRPHPCKTYGHKCLSKINATRQRTSSPHCNRNGRKWILTNIWTNQSLVSAAKQTMRTLQLSSHARSHFGMVTTTRNRSSTFAHCSRAWCSVRAIKRLCHHLQMYQFPRSWRPATKVAHSTVQSPTRCKCRSLHLRIQQECRNSPGTRNFTGIKCSSNMDTVISISTIGQAAINLCCKWAPLLTRTYQRNKMGVNF